MELHQIEKTLKDMDVTFELISSTLALARTTDMALLKRLMNLETRVDGLMATLQVLNEELVKLRGSDENS
jgi:hypothetical protein